MEVGVGYEGAETQDFTGALFGGAEACGLWQGRVSRCSPIEVREKR
jgi:hypothetical protein